MNFVLAGSRYSDRGMRSATCGALALSRSMGGGLPTSLQGVVGARQVPVREVHAAESSTAR